MNEWVFINKLPINISRLIININLTQNTNKSNYHVGAMWPNTFVAGMLKVSDEIVKKFRR